MHLPGIAEGRTVATLALVEEDGRWSEDGIEAHAVPDGAGFRISGTKSYVLDGAQADLVIVAARTAAGTSLFTVDAKDSGRRRRRLFPRWTRPAAWPRSPSTTPRRSSSASRAGAGTC